MITKFAQLVTLEIVHFEQEWTIHSTGEGDGCWVRTAFFFLAL
jgi:hypothetical protein